MCSFGKFHFGQERYAVFFCALRTVCTILKPKRCSSSRPLILYLISFVCSSVINLKYFGNAPQVPKYCIPPQFTYFNFYRSMLIFIIQQCCNTTLPRVFSSLLGTNGARAHIRYDDCVTQNGWLPFCVRYTACSLWINTLASRKIGHL